MRGIAVTHPIGDLGHTVTTFADQSDRLTSPGLIEHFLKFDAATFKTPLQGTG